MARSKNVDSWLYEQDPYLRQIASKLRNMILDAGPELKESVRWSNPIYEGRRRVMYLSATEECITLGFFEGADLVDSAGRIGGVGRRMRQLKVRALEDIDEQQTNLWIKEALCMDAERT